MKTRHTFLLVLILFCSPLLFFGQGFFQGSSNNQDSAATFNPFVDDITLRIPPLEDLIDSAIVNSPLLRSQDADIAIWKYKIKTAKREWMQNLFIDGLLQTDYWDSYTQNFDVSNPVIISNTFQSYQDNNRALVSVSVRLPMDDFWDRKNRIKTATKEVEKSMAIKDNQIIELRKLIIVQYNQLIVNQRILKIANENIYAQALQKEMGDKEFLNGQITLYELAYINEMYRKAVTDYEESRFNFYNAYMLLQEFAGIKFNVINKID